jgi:hypothetical protein
MLSTDSIVVWAGFCSPGGRSVANCSRDCEADPRSEIEQMLVVRITCVANEPSSSCAMNSAPGIPMMNRDRTNKAPRGTGRTVGGGPMERRFVNGGGSLAADAPVVMLHLTKSVPSTRTHEQV